MEEEMNFLVRILAMIVLFFLILSSWISFMIGAISSVLIFAGLSQDGDIHRCLWLACFGFIGVFLFGIPFAAIYDE